MFTRLKPHACPHDDNSRRSPGPEMTLVASVRCRWLVRWVFLLQLPLWTAACSVNPVTGQEELVLMSPTEEVRLGHQQYLPYRQQRGGDYLLDPRLSDYVAQVGEQLVAVSDRKLPYEFVILNNSAPNAWALPGGKIGVNRGLLVELGSEAELAAVLSHEIVHAAARHGAKKSGNRMILNGGLLIAGTMMEGDGSEFSRQLLKAAEVAGRWTISQYSRENELKSDLYGMRYMKRAGYDSMEAVRLQETLLGLTGQRRQTWMAAMLATHPPTAERLARNRETALALGSGGFVGTDIYRSMTAGLRRTQPAYDAHDKGRALLQARPSAALRLARQAIAIEPREAQFYSLKGGALERLGREDQARRAYDFAIDLNPDYYGFYLQRASLTARLGDKAAARRDLGRSLRLLPTDEGKKLLAGLQRESTRRKLVRYRGRSSAQPGSWGALSFESQYGSLQALDAAIGQALMGDLPHGPPANPW